MKTLFFLFCLGAFAAFFSLQSCNDTDLVGGSNDKIEPKVTPRSSLTDIMTYGVANKGDFDVLRSNSIYPFSVLSSTDFTNYKNGTIFDCNNVYRGSTYGLQTKLTLQQFKIWHQIAMHRNILLGSGGTYLSAIPFEQQYADQTNWSNGDLLPGWHPEPEQDPNTCEYYCIDGFGECAVPF